MKEEPDRLLRSACQVLLYYFTWSATLLTNASTVLPAAFRSYGLIRDGSFFVNLAVIDPGLRAGAAAASPSERCRTLQVVPSRILQVGAIRSCLAPRMYSAPKRHFPFPCCRRYSEEMFFKLKYKFKQYIDNEVN
ncbi:hypothetical protein [Cohnella hongkongensis]|uniref:Uncharacterized protein n=1 Tax=Cohnella hongkongensis TaxID=178337 RepID=A0ABV9F9X3_9BACL